MSTGSSKKSRRDRVADLDPTTKLTSRIWQQIRSGDVLLRASLCFLAALIMMLVTHAWVPPLAYRDGDNPRRAIAARVDFEVRNPSKTREARNHAARQARRVYQHDPEPLRQLRAELKHVVVGIIDEKEYTEDADTRWRENFYVETEVLEVPDEDIRQEQYQQFRQALTADGALAKFEKAVEEALADVEKHGLLDFLIAPSEDGETATGPEFNQVEIRVYPAAHPDDQINEPVDRVLLTDVLTTLPEKLKSTLQSDDVVARVEAWLRKNLPEAITLTLDPDRTAERKKEAVDKVAYVNDPIATDTALVAAGIVVNKDNLSLLVLEHDAFCAKLTTGQKLGRALATLGMYIALYTLCGFFIHYRYPKILQNVAQFLGLLTLSTAAVAICYWANFWNAEMIPLLLFAMTVAIAFNRELALLFVSAVGLVVVLSLGQGLSPFVILMAAAATAVLLLGRVRSRTKLIYVGCSVGLVAALTTIGVGIVDSQSFSVSFKDAGYFALWGVVSGFTMLGLLPFVENIFGVITDISLLELGDAAHPLLQELVRRAPGTYNHSINVASMAEAAAESIGAQGLLVRVGAYFHDIGKMFKPQYFVENQSEGDNRHDSLVPAMSTLIIIAHVKDGADLARQHHLPLPMIDFILQHHGTTLVEYFYKRASQQSEENPDADEVDENTFRYPGPKPQTREAGIMMLADAVESASRVLVEPTPARIESLIEELTMKRLLDGQLDESGLTLQEVRTVQDSLAKSLTAVYHGRVKYPDQRTA